MKSQAPRSVTLRAVIATFAVFIVLALSGCVTVTSPDPNPSTPPPTYLDRIKSAQPEPSISAPSGQADAPVLFLNPSRTIVCLLTHARNGNINTPLETNTYDEPRNRPFPAVPIVQCQLAKYPEPTPDEVKNDCGKTGIGYLGGIMTMTPETLQYGACRAGLNVMEQAGVIPETKDSQATEGRPELVVALQSLPRLSDQHYVEAYGFRCAVLDSGVACANISAGLGFYVSEGQHSMFGTANATPTG